MDQQLTIEQALADGAQHYQAGRVAEAEKVYRLILAINPNHAEVLHRLGLCAVAGGNPRAAAELMRQRMERSPLMNAPRFARNIEAAYRRMWREWVGR